MRNSGKDGFIYHLTEGAKVVGDGSTQITKDSFYKILAKGAGSGLPEPVPVGYPFYCSTDITLATGDSIAEWVFSKMGIAKDMDMSFSKENMDATTQIDENYAYVPAKFSKNSGTLNAIYESTDETAKNLLNKFFPSIEDDGAGSYTFKSVNSDVLWFATTLFETTEIGKVEVTIFKPCMINGGSLKKPMEGVLEFNFNYDVDGSQKPLVYYRKVAA
ncbi:hypothetical protein [Spirochaeta cellobiosiphila]|uniref:hypothetical protein n=1 Tax=Spirochaeta cellobiosiphila TaxID=504483 RepID=UPI00040B3599|nr:hypothetical protein [Spirochaeta cellobiosiphila]